MLHSTALAPLRLHEPPYPFPSPLATRFPSRSCYNERMNSTPFWKRPWIIVLALVVIVAALLISSYNGFVTASAGVDTQWAQVETQYQRRYDLIPNLVESVKGLMDQEKEVFTALADARSRYAGAATPDEKAQAAGQVDSALSRLLVVVEAYPALRSSESVQTLMAQLEGTENRVSTERGRYNEAVQAYNLKVRRFPGSIAAAIFGFDARSPFEAADGAETAPAVNFD